MDILELLALLGGLGLFLFGMKLMSDGLEFAWGDKLRKGLETLTSNRFAAVAIGTAFTSVIRSSGVTTVMLVGFVNAGLMTLTQAIFVGMGANIGTTMTAQVVAFKITNIAPALLLAGVIMLLFVKKRNIQRLGQIIFGLGLLFFGMNTMSDAALALSEWQPFAEMLSSISHPMFGILIGMLVAGLIQSSTATMAMLQAFALQGTVGLDAAVYVILGLNIGTCITAILASIGASKEAKRTAAAFLWFNLIGVGLFALLMPLLPVVEWIKSWTPDDAVRQIANFHTFFNIINTAVLIGLPQVLVRLSEWTVRGEDRNTEEKRLKFISSGSFSSIPVVIGQAIKEVTRISEMAVENYSNAIIAFINREEKLAKKVLEKEETVDFLSLAITDSLARLAEDEMSRVDSRIVLQLMKIVIDLERISDHSENIAQAAMKSMDRNVKLSKNAVAEIELMSYRVKDALNLAAAALKNGDRMAAGKVLDIEQEVDQLDNKYTQSHILRLSKGECSPSASAVFTDLIHNLERVADHSTNIAYEILQGDIFTK